jgi:hypothetical protein
MGDCGPVVLSHALLVVRREAESAEGAKLVRHHDGGRKPLLLRISLNASPAAQRIGGGQAAGLQRAVSASAVVALRPAAALRVEPAADSRAVAAAAAATATPGAEGNKSTFSWAAPGDQRFGGAQAHGGDRRRDEVDGEDCGIMAVRGH